MDTAGEIRPGGSEPRSPVESGGAALSVSATGSSSADFADYRTEQAVLASILVEPSSLNTVLSILGGVEEGSSVSGGSAKKAAPGEKQASSPFRRMAQMIFRDPKNALIYESILELQAKQSTIDVLSLADHLRRTKRLEMVGGENALLELQDSVGSTASLESWCEILRDYAMLRETLRACRNAEEMCKNPTGDVRTLLDGVEASLFRVRNNFVRPEIKPLKTLLTETFKHFEDLLEHKIEPGISTGFSDLDKLTGGGLKKQEMFVLAARPSIGKTSLALNIVRNVAMKDVPNTPRKRVMFFSLEMGAEQVAARLLCTESGVPFSSIMDGSFDSMKEIDRLTNAVTRLGQAQLVIDPTGGISIYELRAKARKEKEMNGLDLIVIDYLQLMKAPEAARDGRQVEVSAISGGLKKLAKDLDVPVLVLAQLNREVEKGQGKNARPKLSNLRESGSIEQDADVVVFLHRDRDESKENAQNASSGPIKSELIVEKNRNGKTGVVEVEFKPELMEFRSIVHEYSRSYVPSGHPEGGADGKKKQA